MRWYIGLVLGLFLMLGASVCRAEWMLQIHKGATVEEIALADIDSLTFRESSPPSPQTFYATEDVTIASGMPTYNACNATYLYVGYDNSGPGSLSTLLMFDLSTIPSGAIITQAELDVYQNGCNPVPQAGNVYTGLARIISPWSECSVTWSTAPGSSTLSGCEFPLYCSPSVYAGDICNNLKSTVQGWVNGTYSNYGLGLFPLNATNGAVQVNSSEAPTNRPKLVVYFTSP